MQHKKDKTVAELNPGDIFTMELVIPNTTYMLLSIVNQGPTSEPLVRNHTYQITMLSARYGLTEYHYFGYVPVEVF